MAGYLGKLVLAVAPMLWTSSLGQTMLTQIGIAIIACLAYNVLLGQGGMLSFGHAVYSGLGSFLAIHTLNLVTAGKLALPVSFIPLVGGLAGMLFAIVLFLAFELRERSGVMRHAGGAVVQWSAELVPRIFTVATFAAVPSIPCSTVARKSAPLVGEVSRPSVMAWMRMSFTPAAVAALHSAMR